MSSQHVELKGWWICVHVIPPCLCLAAAPLTTALFVALFVALLVPPNRSLVGFPCFSWFGLLFVLNSIWSLNQLRERLITANSVASLMASCPQLSDGEIESCVVWNRKRQNCSESICIVQYSLKCSFPTDWLIFKCVKKSPKPKTLKKLSPKLLNWTLPFTGNIRESSPTKWMWFCHPTSIC